MRIAFKRRGAEKHQESLIVLRQACLELAQGSGRTGPRGRGERKMEKSRGKWEMKENERRREQHHDGLRFAPLFPGNGGNS